MYISWLSWAASASKFTVRAVSVYQWAVRDCQCISVGCLEPYTVNQWDVRGCQCISVGCHGMSVYLSGMSGAVCLYVLAVRGCLCISVDCLEPYSVSQWDVRDGQCIKV